MAADLGDLTALLAVARAGGLPIVRSGATRDLAVDAAIAGTGVIDLVEDWPRPFLDSGALEPVLEPWWRAFTGPFLHDPSQRDLPASLRACIGFIGFIGFIGEQRT